MVRLITIEREYGSGGAELACQLSELLGWRLLDRALVEDVAREARVSPSLAEECDERLDPWYHRMGKAFWHGSPERVSGSPVEEGLFDGERMVELVRQEIIAEAEKGQCVIVGRGASCILHTFPGAFHVFVFASMKRKTGWFAETFPDRAAQAQAQIEAADEQRAAYVRRYYDRDWDDRALYHLMLDACMGQKAMLGSVLAGAGLRDCVPEPK